MSNKVYEYLEISQRYISSNSEAIISNSGAKGIKIALLDSGLDTRNSNFDYLTIVARNFVKNRTFTDTSGHGTKNASLLAGKMGDTFIGIAPYSTLYVAKVLADVNAKETASAIVKALTWVIDEGVDIVVLPFGSSTKNRVIYNTIDRGLKMGIKFFASAGNIGRETILFPASMQGVIAVSALDAQSNKLDYCSQVEAVDLYIMGKNVPCLDVMGLDVISGSSPACVIASGLEALRLEYLNKLKV